MKKLNFLEKLTKSEQKNITAGTGRNGGSNNNGNVGQDKCTACGPEPACFTAEWNSWYTCITTNCVQGDMPFVGCH